jgi:hypothetical protein
MRNLTLTTWISLSGLALVLGLAVFGEGLFGRWIDGRVVIDPSDDVPGADLTRLPLPPAPEREIVAQYCQTCHHLSRIEKAGGNIDDWTSRIERMIRNGATLPREDVAVVAAYLASALPPRPRSLQQ